MRKITSYLALAILLFCYSCENREVNPEVGPVFSEIHENLEYHFDKVTINGYEYLILERDRNNPHEGFGFMALLGNPIGNKQDSLKAYLETVLEVQTQILAKLNNSSEVEANAEIQKILQGKLSKLKIIGTEKTTGKIQSRVSGK